MPEKIISAAPAEAIDPRAVSRQAAPQARAGRFRPVGFRDLPVAELVMGLVLVLISLKLASGSDASPARTALLFGVCGMVTVYGFFFNPYAPLLCYAFVAPISKAFGTAFALILGGMFLLFVRRDLCNWKWQFSRAGIAFCVWSLASLFWAGQIHQDLDSYIANGLAPMVLAILVSGVRDVKFSRNVMLMVVFACAIGSIFSFLNWSRGIGEQGSGGRIYSLIAPDPFSAWELFGIFGAIAWLLAGHAANWLRLVLAGLLPLLILGLGLCGFRAAILASILGVVVVGLCQRRLMKSFLLLALAAVPVIILNFLMPGMFRVITARFGTISEDRGSDRLDIWEGALHIFSEHPVIGLGLDNFKDAISSYYGQEMLPHSIYIGTLTELGAIGAVLLLIWIGVLLRKSWRTPLRIWTFPLMIAYLFQSAFLHEFYFSCFWLAIGLVEGAPQFGARPTLPRRDTRRGIQANRVQVYRRIERVRGI